MGQGAALALCKPEAKNPDVFASQTLKCHGVKERISEIREIVDSQYAMLIGEKRDVLRRMALGELPTKVIRKANGKIEAVYDRLGAIITDAKLAGEFAAEKVAVDIGPTVKLDFKPAYRNTAITPALEAEFRAIEDRPTEPEPVEVSENPEGVVTEGLEEQYGNAEIAEDSPQLSDIAANNIFVDPDVRIELNLKEIRER
jgi:hypothetical protein